MKRMARSVAMFLAVVCTTGCGSADDGPLQAPFVVHGVIEGVGEGSMGGGAGAEVGLLWVTGGSGCLDAKARVSAEGGAPGTFRLAVNQPPPAEAEFITTIAEDPPVARAYIVAIDEGARVKGYAANADSVVYGLFYAKGAVPGNDAGLGLYGGTALRPGYQLGFFERASGRVGLRLLGEGDGVQIATGAGTSGPNHPACSAR
jgi:hypothetical protein